MKPSAFSCRPLTGKHVFAMFAAFFAVVLAANVALVFEARRSFNGLTEDNAYERGLAYNETLAQQARQTREGWSGKVSYNSETGRFSVTLTDRSGPVAGAKVVLDLIRPVRTGEDRSVALTPSSPPGTYVGALRPPLPGQWDVRLRARDGERTFETLTRIVVPD